MVAKALDRAKIEGLDKSDRLKKQGDAYFNNLEKLAMDKLSFYQCFKCKHPYFGGLYACEEIG